MSRVSSGESPEAGSSSRMSFGPMARRAPDLHHLAHAIGKTPRCAVPGTAQGRGIRMISSTAPAMRDLLAPDGSGEENLRNEGRAPAHMAPDQEILEHGRVLEQVDVLKRCARLRARHIAEGERSRMLLPSKRTSPDSGSQKTRNQVEEARLAAAPFGPTTAKTSSRSTVKRDPVEGRHPTESQRRLPDLEQAHRIRSVRR